MKKKTLLAAIMAMTLASCGEPATSSASSSKEESSSASSSYSYDSYSVSSSEHEPRHNDKEYDYDSVKVNTPTNALGDDFAYGADLSIVAEVEANGGVYYNEDGVEEDVFSILARDGVNYCRLRLWNDPYSKDGLPYGGGTNDLGTDIYLAKRAKAAGMKFLLDFHYSDSWADPGKYWAPKEWQGKTYAGNIARVLGQYTSSVLGAFKDAGVTVDAVQIGNETNFGIAGFSSLEALEVMGEMVDAGVKAAKEVFPSIKTLVHLTNVKSPASIWQFLNQMETTGVDYDIVGLSYYPYWHGGRDGLLSVMNKIHDNYHRPVWVVETSYGNTDEPNENCGNTYHSSTFETPGGYLTSYQGQMTQMADLVDTLSKVKEGYGQGVFYWEPAWLPVAGSTWASKAGQYYNDYGSDGTSEQIEKYTDKSCLPAWCNQGWFDYTGKALPSASTYKHIKQGDKTATENIVSARSSTLSVTVNLKSGISLPSSAQVVTDFDALREKDIVWSQEDIASIVKDGEYEVNGTLNGTFPIKAKVTAETNYIDDYSFEKQGSGEEVEVGGDWSCTTKVRKGGRIEAKSEGNLDGEKYFHWYSASDNVVTLSSEVTVNNIDEEAWDFDLSTYIMAGDLTSDYNEFKMWVKIKGDDSSYIEKDIKDEIVKGWGTPLTVYMRRTAIEHISVPSGETTFEFGLIIDAKGSAWGHNDLWSFALHKEYVVEEYVSDGALEDGDLANQTLASTVFADPWTMDADTTSGSFKVFNESIGIATSELNFAWWLDSAFTFGVHQNIKNLEEGTYSFSFAILSEVSSKYDSLEAYFQVEGEEEQAYDIKSTHSLGWGSGQGEKITFSGLEVPADSKIKVGVRGVGKAGAWGRITDFSLTK